MNMTRRFAARIILASALLVPVVAGAAPGRLPQATQVAPSQTGLSITVDPLDPQHARLVVTNQDGGTWILVANSVSMTYTATGLVVEMKGPGTFTMNGKTGAVSDRGTTRLTFKDGKLVKTEVHEGQHTFPCPPACPGGSLSGSDWGVTDDYPNH
jgi:hypothetical protein